LIKGGLGSGFVGQVAADSHFEKCLVQIRPFSGRLSCQDALHAESDLDSPTISSMNQRPYCFLDAEFLELVLVANNPGLLRMIAGLGVFHCKPPHLTLQSRGHAFHLNR